MGTRMPFCWLPSALVGTGGAGMEGTSISRPRGAAEGEGVDPAPPCRSAEDRTSIPSPSVARHIGTWDLTLRSARSPAQRTLHGRPPQRRLRERVSLPLASEAAAARVKERHP